MLYSNDSDPSCPKCRSVDMVRMASSCPDKFQLPRHSAHEALTIPFGAFMLVYLLASVPFLTGSAYKHLASWPFALSAMGNLLPKPPLSVAVVAVILLVVLDRSTQTFLLSMGRAAALDSRLSQKLDAGAASLVPGVVPVAVAGFGWAVFLGLKSVDSWLAMATVRTLAGPDWVPLAVQGFLAGGVVVLAGLPLTALVMTQAARVFAENGTLERGEASFGDFARNLAYPYALLPTGMALAMSSGLQLLSVLAVCWFLVAMFVAARHTVKDDTELALSVALLGVVPVILVFFFVTLRIQTNVSYSDWASFRDRTSTLPDLGSFWLAGTIALAGLLILIALIAEVLTRRNDARANITWQQAVTRWRRLLYCERCDGVHLPGQKEFVPSSDVGRLLGEVTGSAAAPER